MGCFFPSPLFDSGVRRVSPRFVVVVVVRLAGHPLVRGENNCSVVCFEFFVLRIIIFFIHKTVCKISQIESKINN